MRIKCFTRGIARRRMKILLLNSFSVRTGLNINQENININVCFNSTHAHQMCLNVVQVNVSQVSGVVYFNPIE